VSLVKVRKRAAREKHTIIIIIVALRYLDTFHEHWIFTLRNGFSELIVNLFILSIIRYLMRYYIKYDRACDSACDRVTVLLANKDIFAFSIQLDPMSLDFI
jgi:hypothetical protein